MVREMVADLSEEFKRLVDFRDEIYDTYGYYDDVLLNISYDGASGVTKIKNIINSYRKIPKKCD
jgi:hypothetical protein